MRTGVKLIPKRRLANIEALIKHTAESGETMYGKSKYQYVSGIRTANLLFSQGETTAFYLKDWPNDNYENLKLGTLFPGVVEGIADAASVQASNTDGRYLALKARDTGVGEAEVARLVGAAEPRLGYTLPLNLRARVELTLDSNGTITIGVTAGTAWYTVDTEADAGTDDLNGIIAGVTGDIIVLSPANAARTTVAKHIAMVSPPAKSLNLSSGVDFTMDEDDDFLVLLYDGSAWQEISRSENHA